MEELVVKGVEREVDSVVAVVKHSVHVPVLKAADNVVTTGVQLNIRSVYAGSGCGHDSVINIHHQKFFENIFRSWRHLAA